MKYHIVITDNETGGVELDTNADAIYASVHEKEFTRGVIMSKCSTQALIETVKGLMEILDHTKKKDLEIYRFARILKKTTKKENEKK